MVAYRSEPDANYLGKSYHIFVGRHAVIFVNTMKFVIRPALISFLATRHKTPQHLSFYRSG